MWDAEFRLKYFGEVLALLFHFGLEVCKVIRLVLPQNFQIVALIIQRYFLMDQYTIAFIRADYLIASYRVRSSPRTEQFFHHTNLLAADLIRGFSGGWFRGSC